MSGQVSSEKSVLLQRVKEIILSSAAGDGVSPSDLKIIAGEGFGKMLRTNLAASLLGENPGSWTKGLEYVCAAVEMIHTASLFHDDVIDGASIRRGKPTLWKLFSQNGAILFGDVMYCRALMLLTETEGNVHLRPFVRKAYEVVTAETEQELIHRGREEDTETCIRIARSKTGPFFAIIGQVCGYGDPALAAVLEEVGYNIGTAYQLADDLIDEIGDDTATGKTLGTDRLRKKFTIAQRDGSARRDIAAVFESLCEKSLRLLDPWPEKQSGLRFYINEILYPSCAGAIKEETPVPAGMALNNG